MHRDLVYKDIRDKSTYLSREPAMLMDYEFIKLSIDEKYMCPFNLPMLDDNT